MKVLAIKILFISAIHLYLNEMRKQMEIFYYLLTRIPDITIIASCKLKSKSQLAVQLRTIYNF